MGLSDAFATQRVFRLDRGSQPYCLANTYQLMLAAVPLVKDLTAGQQRTLTHATIELLSSTDIHTLARQMGTRVITLARQYSKFTATPATQQLA